MGSKITVMLVDRREILREGLTAILQRDPTIEVVASFSSGQEAMEQASSIRPDIVITEADMPEEVYLELTHRIKEIPPETRIIAITQTMH